MEQQDKIHLLLSLQEHPENYTDEQITALLADDPELAELAEQLALTKQAFAKREAEHEQIPLDDLWEQFAKEHADEFDTPSSAQQPRATRIILFGSQTRKIAAAFIGVILSAGIAFAAIYVVRNASRPTPQTAPSEKLLPTKPATAHPTDTIGSDTIVTAQPIVFDNVTLEKMLLEIAAYYQAEVVFTSDDARQLRFFFMWRHEETLEHVLNRLNRFESINLELRDKKITVK